MVKPGQQKKSPRGGGGGGSTPRNEIKPLGTSKGVFSFTMVADGCYIDCYKDFGLSCGPFPACDPAQDPSTCKNISGCLAVHEARSPLHRNATHTLNTRVSEQQVNDYHAGKVQTMKQ